MNLVTLAMVILLFAGCTSNWKVQGGPKSCQKMCEDWGLDFTAMVGVGSQGRTGDGATACVCQPRPNKVSAVSGAASSASSLAGPIVAAQAAAAAAAQQQQIQSSQRLHH